MTRFATILNPGNLNRLSDLSSIPTVNAGSSSDVASASSAIPDSVILRQLRRMRSYFSEYFSGTQVKVYINDVRVDMVTIGWNAEQSKTPVYGYASTQYDGIMRGNFIVNGEFSIAFKETAYLHVINEHIKSKSIDTEQYTENLKKLAAIPPDKKLFLLGSLNPAIAPIIAAGVNPDGTTQIVLSDNTIEDILGGRYNFDSLANMLEDSIWGLQNLKPTKSIPRPDELDLIISTDKNGISYSKVGSGFNILITYGNVENPEAESTVKSLTDVHIVSSGQACDPSSGFIIETYRFFARGLDEPIGGMTGFAIQPGDRRPDPENFAPILRTYTIDLTRGVDPSTLTFSSSTLSDITVTIQKGLAAKSISTDPGHAAQSAYIPNPVAKVVVSTPHDWTESDPAHPSITDRNPATRLAILQKLANVILEQYVKPGSDGSIVSQIVEVDGLLNVIEVRVEIS